jgi:hypothetical protein
MVLFIFPMAIASASTMLLAYFAADPFTPFFAAAVASSTFILAQYKIIEMDTGSSSISRTAATFGVEAMKLLVFILLVSNESSSITRPSFVWVVSMFVFGLIIPATKLRKLINSRSQLAQLGIASLENV